jgi:Spermine/spermidine synthase domain
LSINSRSLAVRFAPLALLLVAFAAILFAILSRPPALTLALGEARADRFLQDFAAPESGDGKLFRWSTPGSRLIFHGTSSGPNLLQLHIHGSERLQTQDHLVRIERDKQPIASFTIERPEWRVYQVLLPAGATAGPGADAAPLDLLTSAYYSQQRSLGVPIEWIKLAPLPGTNDLTPVLLRALLLAWGLAGLAGVLWFLDSALLPTTDHRPPTTDRATTEDRRSRIEDRGPRIEDSEPPLHPFTLSPLHLVTRSPAHPLTLLALALVAIGVAVWAWRDPYTLAWATPQGWVLPLGAIGLLTPLWMRGLLWLVRPTAEAEAGAATRRTYAGLFLVSLAMLMYQNLLSRVFSMTMWYHFAFMAISIALFGMTIGALLVYLLPGYFTPERTRFQMAASALAFAISTIISFLTHLSLPFNTDDIIISTVPGIYTIVLTYTVIAVPFVFSGICVTLTLTRFTRQVSRLYAADLTGAAIGCVILVYVLKVTDGPTAVIVAALLAALGAVLFSVRERMPRLLKGAAWTTVIFAALAFGNTLLVQAQSSPLRLIYVRGDIEKRPLYEKWNSFSRIAIAGDPSRPTPPDGWGISSAYPSAQRLVRQLQLGVDAGAGTILTAFHGDFKEVDFLKFDVTNMVHYIRPNSRVLVVGAGGGRDVLSALTFNQKSVVAVEINEDTINAVNERFGGFTGYLDRDPRVKFVNDEARSYIARQTDHYDIIQVSLIDTWVATTAGAFVFTENSLYTTEAWNTFLERLNPNGVLTFSRWYFRDRPGEMYRLTALATTALQQQGVQNPRDHIMIIRRMFGTNDESPHGIGTILVSKQPFTAQDIATIERVAQEMRFELVLSPHASADPVYEKLTSPQDLAAFVNSYPLNIAPTTDDSPFFFQMLRLKDMFDLNLQEQGAMSFNQHAVRVLGILLLVMLVLTLLCIVVPLALTARTVDLSGSLPLFIFFMSIGFGYMLIEMSQMQRLAIFLGHPTYGLSVVLFTLLLSSGLGSSLTQKIPNPETSGAGTLALLGLLGVLLIFGLLTPYVISAFEALTTPLRIAIAIAIIFPIGLCMGMAFPMGMKVASRAAPMLTPWLWGVNGATSVCASVLALAIAFSSSISTSFWIGFGCYITAVVAFVWSKRAALRRSFAPAPAVQRAEVSIGSRAVDR